MQLSRALMLTLAVGWAGASLGAAPATPSYYGIDSSIARIQAEWRKPGVQVGPYEDAWNAFFDGIRKDLGAYAAAQKGADRSAALSRLEQTANALQSSSWAPAAELSREMQTWLRPRINLAWAERGVVDAIRNLPASADASHQANRERWVKFVDENVSDCLREMKARAKSGSSAWRRPSSTLP